MKNLKKLILNEAPIIKETKKHISFKICDIYDKIYLTKDMSKNIKIFITNKEYRNLSRINLVVGKNSYTLLKNIFINKVSRYDKNVTCNIYYDEEDVKNLSKIIYYSLLMNDNFNKATDQYGNIISFNTNINFYNFKVNKDINDYLNTSYKFYKNRHDFSFEEIEEYFEDNFSSIKNSIDTEEKSFDEIKNLLQKDLIHKREKYVEDLIKDDPELCFYYAKNVIHGRFPEGEKGIATNAIYSYEYAKEVIKERFPLGEKIIAADANYAQWYSYCVIKGPWPEGEAAIATSALHSFQYARYSLKGRFPEGEKIIATNPEYLKKYNSYIKKINK